MDEKVEDVDYVFNSLQLRLDQVKDVANLEKLWGKDCQEPVFIVKGITIESCKMEYKKSGICYCSQFTHNGITYKKRFCSKVVYEEMTRKADLKFGRSQQLDLVLLVKFKKERGFYYAEILDFNSVKSSKIILTSSVSNIRFNVQKYTFSSSLLIRFCNRNKCCIN